MLKHLKMKNYKGFSEIEFNNFNKINIFVGDNNIGKTTILEAIDLISDPFNYEKIVSNLNKKNKEQNPYYSIKNLFNKKNDSKKIEFNYNYFEDSTLVISKEEREVTESLDNESNRTRIGMDLITEMLKDKKNLKNIIENNIDDQEIEKVLKEVIFKGREIDMDKSTIKNKELKYITTSLNLSKKDTLTVKEDDSTVREQSIKDKIFNSKLITPIDRLQYINSKFIIDELINDNHDHKLNLLEAMKMFDENIVDINYSLGERDYSIAMKNNKKSYSVGVGTFGDGFKTLLILLAYIYKMEDGILLIDEMENGLYKDVIKKLYKVLINTIIGENVQMFSTTHSLEAITALIEGSNEHIKDISVYKIGEFKEKYYIDEYRGEKIKKLIELGGDPR